MPTFEEALAQIRKRNADHAKKERERPRLEFIAAAQHVGFTSGQAKFMWDWLAQKEHEHWDGIVR